MNDWNLFAAKLGQMVKDSKMEVSNIKHKKQVPSLSMAKNTQAEHAMVMNHSHRIQTVFANC